MLFKRKRQIEEIYRVREETKIKRKKKMTPFLKFKSSSSSLSSILATTKQLVELIFKSMLFFDSFSLTAAKLVETEYPRNEVDDVEEHAYVFVPLATVIGFAAVGLCLLLIIVAKIIFASSDQYMLNNRYDLVIYKQVSFL